MNIKLISLVISIILILFIGGYIIVLDTGGNNNNPDDPEFNTSIPEVNEEIGVSQNQLPPSIEKLSESSYEIDKDMFVENHSSILEANSVTFLESSDKYNKTVKKSGNKIYLKEDRDNYKTEKYQTEKFTIERVEQGTSVGYDSTRESLDKSTYSFRKDLNLYIKSLDLIRVKSTDQDDILLYMNGQNNLDALANSVNFDSISNADAFITVNKNGLVENMKIKITGRTFGSADSKTINYNIGSLSNTNVEEPGWLQSAKEQESIVRASADEENSIIKISYEGLSTIKPNTNITIQSEDSTHNVTVREEVGENDDLFLIATQNGWNTSVNNITQRGVRDVSGLENIYYDYQGNRLFSIDF